MKYYKVTATRKTLRYGHYWHGDTFVMSYEFSGERPQAKGGCQYVLAPHEIKDIETRPLSPISCVEVDEVPGVHRSGYVHDVADKLSAMAKQLDDARIRLAEINEEIVAARQEYASVVAKTDDAKIELKGLTEASAKAKAELSALIERQRSAQDDPRTGKKK